MTDATDLEHVKRQPYMTSRKLSKKSYERFKRRFRRNTGYSFSQVMKGAALLVIAVVGIGLTVLFTNAEQSDKPSGITGIESKQLSSAEQFLVVTDLPKDFAKRKPVEMISILKSKIETGEELAGSEGHYAQRGTDQLVTIYGTLCYLQESAGIDSSRALTRLVELRQQAVGEGNEARVAVADFYRALSATESLNRRNESGDFRFATEAISALDSKHMVNPKQFSRLCDSAIELHDNSPNQDRTAILLSTLGDKLASSPVSAISSLGLNMKDHAKYARYYVALDELPYTTRESKLEFFREMFTEIEKAPPQSLKTYQVVFQLIDRLVNKSDAFFAGILTKRLREATPMISPTIRTKVNKSINGIETRVALLGKTVDIFGSKFDGSPLQFPNDKPTTLVFWRHGHLESMEYLKSLATSSRFNPWATNVLVACLSKQPVEEFEKLAQEIGKFTVLDYPTSVRLGGQLAIEFVPYEISLDKDGKVLRLGAPKH